MLGGESGDTKTVKIDKASGLLATDLTPPDFIEEKTFSNPHSILYYIDKNNPLGPIPTNPEKDPQFRLWENAIMRWAEKKASSSGTALSKESPPTESDNLHTKENLPTIKIIEPSNNQIVDSAVISVNIEASAPRGISYVEFFLDGSLFGQRSEEPYLITKRIDFLENGFHNIKVRACDDINNCSEAESEFNLSLPNNLDRAEGAETILKSITSGQMIKKTDFPYQIDLSSENYQNIASINISLINASSTKTSIGKIQNIEDNDFSFIWIKAPDKGKYEMVIETLGWRKDIINTINTSVKIE
ncbi:MAG: hypothetical protein HGA69_00670 [Desulfobulbaceae bacterium]|nr:hypothetical protein [Desulfobulbaceae bacterium]